MSVKVGLVIYLLIVSVLGKNEELIGNKVYKIKLENKEQQEKIQILMSSDYVDFWRNPVFEHGRDGLAMVSQQHTNWFEDQLNEIGMKIDIVIDDVYDFLNEMEGDLVTTNIVGDRPFTFDAYYSYSEIVQHLQALATRYAPMEITESGTTEEDRKLYHAKISTTDFANQNKPVIVIEAGIIAREWITIPAAINIIENLFLPQNSILLNGFDWIIIPVTNPDGYEYSYSNLRSWKKNRSFLNGSICTGVNINRNFDIAWRQPGGSSSPCSDLFAGFEAFSEAESRMIKDIFKEYKNRIGMYISIQNEGPLFSYPWRFERAASGMFRLHHLLGLSLLHTLEAVDDNPLNIGSISFGERASGTASDYMQHNGIRYSINMGVQQADGRNGFIIPETNIRNFIEPIWRAVKYSATYILYTYI